MANNKKPQISNFIMHAKFHLNRSHIETNIKLFQYLFASGFDVKLSLVDDLYILCCYTRLSLLTKLQACSIKRTAFFPATCHSIKNLKNEVLDCIMSLGFGQWTIEWHHFQFSFRDGCKVFWWYLWVPKVMTQILSALARTPGFH